MRHVIAIMGLLLLTTLNLRAQTITFHIIPGGPGNLIRFESKAPMETVVGTTDQVVGHLMLDPADLSKGVSGEFTVAAATLKTGNSIRDGHMRSHHLETDKYPDIKFFFADSALTGVLSSGAQRHFEVTGQFSLHGVTKTITVPVEVTLIGEGAARKIHMVATFQVGLSEYNIVRPQFLIMKLDEIQHITVDIWGAAP